MLYYYGQPVRFMENAIVDIDVLSGTSTVNGDYIGYRTDYSDVEEIVDRKYWQPSTVAVSQVGKHPSNGTSMYDSSDVLKSTEVARLNASIRHPGNDIVDTSNQLNALKKITIEVAESDIRAQLHKIESENKGSVPNSPSTPPDATIGG